ncbi:hypothetical protein GCM10009854_25780 [Saccharopolyspora halophila]|uniref:DUF3515 domain-containing protein n=1 Tax=Saccharopolyspora halophila TaxID=405551 RepID=A0ABP5TAY0_9PSEU
MEQDETGLPRPVLIIAIALGVVLAVGVAGVGVYGWWTERTQQQAEQQAEQARRTGPLAMPPVPAPQAQSPDCAKVIAALPQELTVEGQPVPRREIAQPAPAATVAWGDAEHDPVTVRCGIGSPAELTRTSQLMVVNGVSWFEINEAGNVSWLAVDRGVRVALNAPAGIGTGPLQELSDVLKRTLPKRPVFP